MLTFNRAAEAITGVIGAERRRAAGRRRSCSCRRSSPTLFGARDGSAAAAAGRVRVHALGTAAQIELGHQHRDRCITPRGETGFLFTFQDVTEARKHDREARVQQRLAAVGEMAAGIAHEIRNPLASMSGSIQILRARAAAHRRAVAADGHRAARVRSAERDDPQLPRRTRGRSATAIDAHRRAAGRSPTRRACCRTAPELTERA